MDLHYANWERFCRYHVGDWYGLWTPYTVDGVGFCRNFYLRHFEVSSSSLSNRAL